MSKITILFLLCLMLSSGNQVQSIQPPNPPDQRFGMTESFWLPEDAYNLGVGWERILFYWREIQPSGPEDWNTLHIREEWLAQANSQGRMVVGLLKNTAPWASEDGTEAGLPKGLYLPRDDPGNLWAQFVRQIAQYYGSRNVHHWIIWNEPEIQEGVYGHEFNGTAEDYYQLLKIAYMVMKETDPEATILLAGLTWWHDQSYLERLFELMVDDPEASQNDYFFDALSLHIYFRSETIRSVIDAVKEVERKFNLDKPIWINETNAPPNLDPLWPVDRPMFDVDVDQQAWFIIQAFSLGFAEGAERISVYKLIDINLPPGGESFGIMRPDFSHRPAYEAYKLLTQYLGGFSEVKLEESSTYYHVLFSRPTGVTHVLWTRTSSPVEISLDISQKQAIQMTVDGRSERMVAENGEMKIDLEGAICIEECLIGGPPVIIVEGPEANLTSGTANAIIPSSFSSALNVDLEITTPSPVDSPVPQPSIASTVLSTTRESIALQDNSLSITLPELSETAKLPAISLMEPTDTLTSSQAASDEVSTTNSPSMIGLYFLAAGLVSAMGIIAIVWRSKNK